MADQNSRNSQIAGVHLTHPDRILYPRQGIKGFSKAIAGSFVQAAPKRYAAAMSKAKRKGKIFIDYLRNHRSATTVAAYSSRATPDAPVSVPISWDGPISTIYVICRAGWQPFGEIRGKATRRRGARSRRRGRKSFVRRHE
ncbi:MAG: hypothetical protein ACREV3_11555 [Gammaproteobacteria bacterium]